MSLNLMNIRRGYYQRYSGGGYRNSYGNRDNRDYREGGRKRGRYEMEDDDRGHEGDYDRRKRFRRDYREEEAKSDDEQMAH